MKRLNLYTYYPITLQSWKDPSLIYILGKDIDKTKHDMYITCNIETVE